MLDLRERMARIETRHEAIMDGLERVSDNLAAMSEKVTTISAEIGRYKGAYGVVMAMLAGMGAVWSIVGDYVKRHWS